MAEDYHWRVTYRDGSVLDELLPDGRDHVFADIDLPRVARMTLVRHRPGHQEYTQDIAPGQVPVFVRRRSISVSLGPGEQGDGQTVHVLGWETAPGLRDGAYRFFWADGTIKSSRDFNFV